MHVPDHLQSLFWKSRSINMASKVLWISMLAAVLVVEGKEFKLS